MHDSVDQTITRRRNWGSDRIPAAGYCRTETGKQGVTGTKQTKDAMWDRIEEKFFTTMKKDGSYRTQDQLTSKWSHINKKVRKFMGVYEDCSPSRRSGTNDADVLRLAKTRYQDDGNQVKVPIDLWRILSRSPKWQQLNNPDGGSFRKRSIVDAEVEVDETIGSTDQIPSLNAADSDDEDPIPRPIGRKKAKSIASGSGGSASVSASPRDEIGRAMIEQLRVFNLQEQERLKLKEKELKLKEQEAEMKVMQTDPRTLSEFGRIIYEQRMREIKEKYNLPWFFLLIPNSAMFGIQLCNKSKILAAPARDRQQWRRIWVVTVVASSRWRLHGS
ncbi:unnamed protein product [Cuscuta campestris]|uniref:No apical meristem-associated C-terminal domain-containing protein n=1 Tax=Cuscuta campestris TaxID=132261 RepID=A0A484M5N8_9ASTE|nr:unnamed protein product [Cuscuta campestris]